MLITAIKAVKDMFEKRDIIHGSTSIIDSFLKGSEAVTEDMAMEIPAVATSVDLISSSIAKLPVKLYRLGDEDDIIEVKHDKRLELLNKEANHTVNSFNLKKRIAKDYLFHGRSFVYPQKIRNNFIGLYHLPQESVRVKKYLVDGFIPKAKIQIMDPNDNDTMINEINQWEVVTVLKDSSDGITGHGVLQQNQKFLKMALNEIEYSNSILENGTLPVGTLSAQTSLSENALKRLKESWANTYMGAKQAGKTLILEEGLEYKPVSLKPNELELTNAKKSTVSEVARMFNIPESMINSNANKYNSNEQNNIHFLQFCIAPILSAIEAGLNRTLLLEAEKDTGFYFEFDTSELIKTTEKEKVEAVSEGFRRGLYTMNEARSMLGMKDIESEDYFLRGLGDIFIDAKTGIITVPNIGRVIDPNTIGDQSEEGDEEENEKILEELEKMKEEPQGKDSGGERESE